VLCFSRFARRLQIAIRKLRANHFLLVDQPRHVESCPRSVLFLLDRVNGLAVSEVPLQLFSQLPNQVILSSCLAALAAPCSSRNSLPKLFAKPREFGLRSLASLEVQLELALKRRDDIKELSYHQRRLLELVCGHRTHHLVPKLRLQMLGLGSDLKCDFGGVLQFGLQPLDEPRDLCLVDGFLLLSLLQLVRVSVDVR